LLEQLTEVVYASSANVASEPYACNLNGLSKLECSSSKKPLLKDPIRSATLSGLFIPESYMEGWKLSKAGTDFYGGKDFEEMAAAGLNTVILPVPLSAWNKKDKDGILKELEKIIKMVDKTDKLHAIVQLVVNDDVDDVPKAVEKAVGYVVDLKHSSTVLAVEIPDKKYLADARSADTHFPVLVPLNMGLIQRIDDALGADPNTYGVLSMAHTSTVADIASSTSLDDRMKLFYHESVACMQRAPIEYTACFHNLPVLVTGFDLSIDNCALQGVSDLFVDYGQCGRFDETANSEWWLRHRQSFAARQLFANEQGLGWTYPAWKLWGKDVDYDVVDRPSKLLSLKAVLKAGLMPDLTESVEPTACLNPPATDFVLGDATLAPTPGPPPDCSPGWWNATIDDCTYWVPPPTDSPIACPVCEECDGEGTPAAAPSIPSVGNSTEPEPMIRAAMLQSGSPLMGGRTDLAMAFGAGAIVALLMGSVWRAQRRPRRGYEAIPTN